MLAKAQAERMLGVPTKREPGLSDYHHSHIHASDYVHHTACHGGGTGANTCSKESTLVASSSANAATAGYHYVTTSSTSGHVTTTGQEQHIVYTG